MRSMQPSSLYYCAKKFSHLHFEASRQGRARNNAPAGPHNHPDFTRTWGRRTPGLSPWLCLAGDAAGRMRLIAAGGALDVANVRPRRAVPKPACIGACRDCRWFRPGCGAVAFGARAARRGGGGEREREGESDGGVRGHGSLRDAVGATPLPGDAMLILPGL